MVDLVQLENSMKKNDELELCREILSALGLNKETTDTLIKEYENYYSENDVQQEAPHNVNVAGPIDEYNKHQSKTGTKWDTSCSVNVKTPTEPVMEKEIEDAIPESKPVSEPQSYLLADDVTVLDPVHNVAFDLNLHANGLMLKLDPICITFDSTCGNECVPGITEKQLLWVLYARYQNNPEKLKLVKELLSKEFN